MIAPTYYTAEMVRSLPEDDNRYETVHGELLVTRPPAPLHDVTVSRILRQLGGYLEHSTAGLALSAPADISWSPDVLVQPDVFVVPLDEARTIQWSRIRNLLIVVEVVSRATSRRDRFSKRRLYQEVGIPCYWIVDPDKRLIEIWKPEDTLPRVARDRVSWRPPGESEAFLLGLDQLFSPAQPRRTETYGPSRKRA